MAESQVKDNEKDPSGDIGDMQIEADGNNLIDNSSKQISKGKVRTYYRFSNRRPTPTHLLSQNLKQSECSICHRSKFGQIVRLFKRLYFGKEKIKSKSVWIL